jgi:DNA polymerase-1
VNLPALNDAAMAPLREVLEDAQVEKTGHNLKFMQLLLRNEGVTLRGGRIDTMLVSYVLDPGRRDHTPGVLALEFLERPVPSHESPWQGEAGTAARRGSDGPGATLPASMRCCCSCATALRRSCKPGMEVLYETIELPSSCAVGDGVTGVAIDTVPLPRRVLPEGRERRAGDLRFGWERFNINSNPQLRVILFERLGLPVNSDEYGTATDASVLQELAEEDTSS